MESSFDIESDYSEIDDEADTLVQDYLNDTRVESVQVKTRSDDVIYTQEQLDDIALYKNAIALNRETENTYKKLEESLFSMLKEVRKKLKENEATLIRHNSSTEGGFNYLRCGKPYFKDRNNFPAPDNEDTIMMRQAQMYDFSQVSSVPGWTVKDKTELVSTLLEFSKDIKRNECRSRIAMLRKDNSSENLLEIARLEREITQLNKKTLFEIALPLDQEYEWEDLANSLNRRHTAQEYKALWKLFFHPSINKNNWSRIEHQDLQTIAQAHNMQDWDSIAQKLNTGRTGYQCFVYYRTNMVDITSYRKWTSEEMEYLQRVIDFFREGTYIPWGKVASAMEGRTKIQVYNKYTRMLERRKGRFLEEEDVVIMNCYDKYGDNFKKITEFLPGRSAVQLKTRFNLLTKIRLSTTWTVAEDKKLLQIMANLDSNSNFSTATTHFPGKDRINIRSRYVTLMKWMKAHPATDISMAPRRGARRLIHGQSVACDLKDAIANLNKRIETEVSIKKKAKITRSSTEEEIENGIIAALVNEIIKEEAHKKLDRSELGSDSDPVPPHDPSTYNISNLHKLLIFLKVSLDKTSFLNSKYASQYPDLKDAVLTESLVKVKSYSKTKAVETVALDGFPDIWGKKKGLKQTSYVLPPNYSTITGCRVLMKHFGAKPEEATTDAVDLGMMLRKNSILNRAMTVLKERFITLFLWPILLSNEKPKLTLLRDRPYVSKPVVKKKLLPNPTGLTIPVPRSTQLRFQLLDEVDIQGIDEPKRRKLDLNEIQYKEPNIPYHTSDEDSTHSINNSALEKV